MGTYHYHTIRCPHCGEDDGQVGCSLSACHFAQESTDLTEYPKATTCQHCGEAYSFDDGCWSGEVPPWDREELVSEEAAELIEDAIALAHKRIGFREFKEKVRAYEERRPDLLTTQPFKVAVKAYEGKE